MEFSISVIDDAGAAKTGGAASTTIKVRRVTDNFFFDHNDSTFKATPTTLTSAMTETEVTRWAGRYKKDYTITGWDDGYYDVIVKYDDGTLVRNGGLSIYIADGDVSDKAIHDLDTAIKVKTDNLPDGIVQNASLNNFEFFMVNDVDHIVGKTGLTITATRSIDGAAFAACANAASEVSDGMYKINLAATDLNGVVVTFKFTGAGADNRMITILTQI